MKVSTVFAILAVAVATSEAESIFSRLYFPTTTTMKPTAKPQEASTTTTTTTTQATTTTTLPTTTTVKPPPQFQQEAGELPPQLMESLLSMFDTYPQLMGKEDEILNGPANAGPVSLSSTISELSQPIQDIFKCLTSIFEKHIPGGPLVDLNSEVVCEISKWN